MLRDILAEAFEIGRHPLSFANRASRTEDSLCIETLTFTTSDGEKVRGYLTRPAGASDPLPALLYIHAHGDNYRLGADELLAGRRALQGPLGPPFAEHGLATLTIDLPGFGTRAAQTESALAKARLWYGGSLAGQMLGELSSALDYLASRPEIDASRIGAFGISMGATYAYWLAAVDKRISAVAHLCCYADFGSLIAARGHDGHGIYLTIPGLLNIAGNGAIAGLVAPRPQLAGIGDADALTPPQAVDTALKETRAAYAAAGADDRFILIRDPVTGHEETPEMRAAVLKFFARTLCGPI